jgi:DNA-binding CsgD family transcriptional regulator
MTVSRKPNAQTAPKAKHLPHRYWQDRREELARDALTMDNQQLAAKHNTTSKRISNILSKFSIKSKVQNVCWETREHELKLLAETHTPTELAAHFGTNLANMYSVIHRYGVTAAAADQPVNLAKFTDELTRLAPTMTEPQLAQHFCLTRRTVRNHLKRNGLQCLAIAPTSRASQWRARKPEIEQMLAKGCRAAELAQHFKTSPDFIRKTLHRLGLKLGRIPPTPKAKRPRATKPKIHAGLQAVPSTSIKTPAMTTAPVEIIVPENVKTTIVKFTPSPGMRLCNGTSSGTYQPALHGGVMRSCR